MVGASVIRGEIRERDRIRRIPSKEREILSDTVETEIKST